MTNSESVYDRGYLINFDNNELVLYRTPIRYTPTQSDKYHPIAYNETLLSIAMKYYGSSSLWFMIADVNDNIEDIFNLPVGDLIIIPNVLTIQSNYAKS